MRTILAAGLLAAAVTLTACGSSAVTIRGQIDVSNNSTFSTACGDTSDFPDVTPGTQVVVRSPSGSVLGSGSLGQGKTDSADGIAVSCNYPFTVTGVAAQSRYGVEVASRGTVWFTSAQVAKPIALSLGGS
jgi:hypothetical protein